MTDLLKSLLFERFFVDGTDYVLTHSAVSIKYRSVADIRADRHRHVAIA